MFYRLFGWVIGWVSNKFYRQLRFIQTYNLNCFLNVKYQQLLCLYFAHWEAWCCTVCEDVFMLSEHKFKKKCLVIYSVWPQRGDKSREFGKLYKKVMICTLLLVLLYYWVKLWRFVGTGCIWDVYATNTQVSYEHADMWLLGGLKFKMNFCVNLKGGCSGTVELRHCTTGWKVMGSIPNGIIGIFH